MNPESESIRKQNSELPPFSRLVSGMDEEILDSMMNETALKVAIEGAGYPWDDEAACEQLSQKFPKYEAYEIGALAKRLELEKNQTRH